MRKIFYKLSCFFLAGCAEYSVEIQGQPELIPLKDDSFIVNRDFKVVVNGSTVTVPHGFVTDLASIPKCLQPVYSPTDFTTIAPSVLHDYMYSGVGIYNRKQSDAIFYNALIENGAGKIQAFKFWAAVRLFGGLYYKNYGGE